MSGNDTDPVVRIAARGDGVTRSGRHVASAVPGDWLDENGQLHRGPHWRQPVCAHFGRCGGCQLQQADDTTLADFARDRIVNALAAHDIGDSAVGPAYLSPPGSRRRTTLRVQRSGPTVRIGFSERGSNRLINIKGCDVLHPKLIALVQPLRAMLPAMIGPRDVASIHLTLVDQGVDVLITGTSALGLAAHEAIVEFCSGHEIARLAVDGGDGPEDRWSPQPVSVTLGGVPVPVPHAAFLQATRDGEDELVRCVHKAVGLAATCADLFSGIGTFALSLSDTVAVHAVEAGRDPILALRTAANRHQRRITTEHRDLYRRPLTVAELARFDTVILDPPRAGASEQVAMLADSSVPVIAYVSCNPTSFARDAARLMAGGYRLEWVRPVGQFRWSTHVELVACLRR